MLLCFLALYCLPRLTCLHHQNNWWSINKGIPLASYTLARRVTLSVLYTVRPMPYNKNSVSPTEESKRVKISYSSRVKGVSESVSEPLFLFVPVLYFP